jgi:hypothetical protein
MYFIKNMVILVIDYSHDRLTDLLPLPIPNISSQLFFVIRLYDVCMNDDR